MATTSLNDPIDGAELKQIILERITRALDKDCTLSNDIAYAGFALKFQIDLKFLRSKTAPTLVWGTEVQTVDPAIATEDEESVILADTYETDSPNTAREEHSLPIPVLVQTPNGPQRKKVHVNPRGTK